MKYISYFLAWVPSVFGVSFYYKFFWDIFYHVYYQDTEVLVYGFTPSGMPPFNWKINLLIWLSGIILMGVVIGLVMDGVCRSHYKKRKKLPLAVVIANQGAACVLYMAVGVLSSYHERLYYMPRFLLEIMNDIFPSFQAAGNTDLKLFLFSTFHVVIFAALSLYFYMWERRKQNAILEREEEYRCEREISQIAEK